MSASKPKDVTVRTYRVGFGDCFLLSFTYQSGPRHVLIDFGTKSLPEDAVKDHMKKVAEQIKKDCGGRLHVVIATHRHQDHINGFATNEAGTASGDIIASCKPDVVIQPWTEDPDIDTNATAPALRASAHHRMTLNSMQHYASQVVTEFASRRTKDVRLLRFKGENAIKNKTAVKNLIKMGANKPLYLKRGDKLNLESILPGVKVTVLGPPTVKEAGSFTFASDSPEYWVRVNAAWTALTESDRPKSAQKTSRLDVPLAARWFVHAADCAHREDALNIVTALDGVLNNTSLILLFEAAGKKLLFPGDAQLENWSVALSSNTSCKLLKDVDLYKVGHHGSRNANPKKLWDLFEKKKASGTKRLTTILSTKDDVFNETYEVPRKTLVAALKSDSNLHDTRKMKGLQDSDP